MSGAAPLVVFCEELEYSIENPWRRPDWRSMRATLQTRTRRSDEWVKRVQKFRAEDEAERIDKEVFRAHQIHRGPRWRRAELQARILAGQLPAAIAACTGVTLSELLAYEQIFFDVRTRRSSSFIVQHCVIEAPPFGVYGWNDVEKFWGFEAYRWGYKAVDILVGSVTHERLDQYGLDAYLCKDCPVHEDLRFAVMAARIPLGKRDRDVRAYKQIIDQMSDEHFETPATHRDPAVPAPDRQAERLPKWEQCLASAREIIPDFQLTI